MSHANSQKRFVLVTRKTRLQELVERFNTWPQAKFYLEHNQVDVQDYLDEHETYLKQVAVCEHVLNKSGRLHKIERDFLPNYQFSAQDIVVVIGQDGLVANTLKYLHSQPVIGINPDPQRLDGKLLSFQVTDLESLLPSLNAGEVALNEICFAMARTNTGHSLLAVNDLFIGPKSHSSIRYQLNYNGQVESQLSSGLIVSTGFGSTGWLSSILAGAFGITQAEQTCLKEGFQWDSEKLMFAVREPFVSQTSQANIVFGAVTAQKSLILESYMPENGVIFSDGIESDYIPFNSGTVLTIGLADHKGRLVAA